MNEMRLIEEFDIVLEVLLHNIWNLCEIEIILLIIYFLLKPIFRSAEKSFFQRHTEYKKTEEKEQSKQKPGSEEHYQRWKAEREKREP